MALLATLIGCRIQMHSSEGGSISTLSGNYHCAPGQPCADLAVDDLLFDETFIAEPEPGYEFIGWRKRYRGLCGGSSGECRLFTSGFAGNDLLMGFLDRDDVFYLEAQFAPQARGLSKLSAAGSRWVDAQGNTILLKGTNLGNWLLQEFWMMNQSSNPVAIDQCTLESTLDNRFGRSERERLIGLFRANWIGERDWDLMASFGINVVRLPFVWNLIEDEDTPMTLRDDAWRYLDYAVDEAEARGMYVILDLHGAVGGQSEADHSGCAGENRYWSTPAFQQRTEWLWQQIAGRYGGRGAIAAYSVMNEPWGTDSANMASEMLELYSAIRAVDSETVVLLPGYFTGIDDYGRPGDFGGENVGFEMHFYPGFFGWGQPDYETHRDWLACGRDGQQGVCAWDEKIRDLRAAFLVGEMQPWANLGEAFGAGNARASFDRYASFNWATTSWAWKVLTGAGGTGRGTWGMVTNQADGPGLAAKADTWTCAGWNSDFARGCVAGAGEITPSTSGLYYLVLKAGSCCNGQLDVSFDSVSLRDDTDTELLTNGGFGSADGWTVWTAADAAEMNFNARAAGRRPAGGSGPALRMFGSTTDGTPLPNGGVYQAIELVAGRRYSLSGVFRDNGSENAWAEILLLDTRPRDGEDIVPGDSIPAVDFATADIADIERLFALFGTVEYEVHEKLRDALTASEPSRLYTLPSPPEGLTISVDADAVGLSWNASAEPDVTGYNLYRSDGNRLSFRLLAENVPALSYQDTNVDEAVVYFYRIAAVDGEDVSYPSVEVATGTQTLAIPGRIEAELFSRNAGFQLEPTSDSGGGVNTGFADAGDVLEYDVSIASAGTYTVSYRLASLPGSEGFSLSINGSVIDSVAVPATGGWQTWVTISTTVNLPAGEHSLRFESVGGEWNMNWFGFEQDL